MHTHGGGGRHTHGRGRHTHGRGRHTHGRGRHTHGGVGILMDGADILMDGVDIRLEGVSILWVWKIHTRGMKRPIHFKVIYRVSRNNCDFSYQFS